MGLVAFFAVWASAVDAKRRVLPNKLLGAMCISAIGCLLVRTLGSPWLDAFPWLWFLSRCLPKPSTCVYLAIFLSTALFLIEGACRALTHQAGIGFGDIKLLGCWTLALGGWTLIALLIACFAGALWGLLHHERTFPLGPFITLAALALALAIPIVR